MSSKEKLVRRFLSNPCDFTFDEGKRLFGFFGFEEYQGGRSSGSSMSFVNKETNDVYMLHKPHPEKYFKRYVIKSMRLFLIEKGYIEKR